MIYANVIKVKILEKKSHQGPVSLSITTILSNFLYLVGSISWAELHKVVLFTHYGIYYSNLYPVENHVCSTKDSKVNLPSKIIIQLFFLWLVSALFVISSERSRRCNSGSALYVVHFMSHQFEIELKDDALWNVVNHEAWVPKMIQVDSLA